MVRNIGIREKVEKVDLTLKKGTAELLTETYFLCNVEDKDVYLYYLLLNHPGKTLVFANAIDGVMNLVITLIIVRTFEICRASHVTKNSKYPSAKIVTSSDLKLSVYVLSGF